MNENSDGSYTKYITKTHFVEFVKTEHLKYIGLWIIYNRFSIGDKAIEDRLG